MDKNTKKLISALKEMRSKLLDMESKDREGSDLNESKSYYYCGYYDGRADGYAKAYQMLGSVVSNWAEECISQMQI